VHGGVLTDPHTVVLLEGRAAGPAAHSRAQAPGLRCARAGGNHPQPHLDTAARRANPQLGSQTVRAPYPITGASPERILLIACPVTSSLGRASMSPLIALTMTMVAG
jgi:hypothetical protein